jgi:hypothetical protein
LHEEQVADTEKWPGDPFCAVCISTFENPMKVRVTLRRKLCERESSEVKL